MFSCLRRSDLRDSDGMGHVVVYWNPQTDTLSFLNFFLNVGEGTPTVASGPLSATFPGLAKSSSYATGLQRIFPE